MKILHVAETAKGGVGTYLAETLPYQLERLGRTRLRVLLPDSHGRHAGGFDRRIVRTWRRRGRSGASIVSFAVAIQREVQRFRPDIIHAHSTLAGLVVRLLYGWQGSRRRFGIVYCPHGWGFDRDRDSLSTLVVRHMERHLAPLCDKIVAVSEHEWHQARDLGIAEERLSLVRNGISDRPVPPPGESRENRLRCLFVGRLDRQKGLDTLLDAADPFADRITLRIVGAAVADHAQRRRQSPHIAYLGWRSRGEIAAEIAAADVVVMPSRWEAFGLVALEAMRAGRAVVASAVGGLPEIVVEGVTGRLAPPDSPLPLMGILTDSTRETWLAMGRAGRERYLAHFTSERMNRELSVLYDTVLAARSRSTQIHKSTLAHA